MASHDDTGQEGVETLLQLQHRWHAALAERLERYVTTAVAGQKQAAARAAFRDTTEENLALRLLLDEYAHHPVLAVPRRWEHIMLADAAGIRGPSGRERDLAAAGAMLVADLRPGGSTVRHGGRLR